MNTLNRLFYTNRIIFSLLGIGIILDVTGVMSSIMPGASFSIGGILVIAYFLGVSALLRFGLARRPIHVALTWIVIIALYIGWFMIQVAVGNDQYRPSILFFLCVVAAFKTMRFEDINITTHSSDIATEIFSIPVNTGDAAKHDPPTTRLD